MSTPPPVSGARSPIPRGPGSAAVQAAANRSSPPPTPKQYGGPPNAPLTGRPSTAGSPGLPAALAALGAPRPGTAGTTGTVSMVNPGGAGSPAPGGPESLNRVRANLKALNETIVSATGDGSALAQHKRKQGSQIVLSEDRVNTIKEDTVRVEQHLALEVKRRAEGDRQLQTLIESRARDMAEALERRTTERLVNMHRNVDKLTKQVDELSTELAAEREKNVRLTQELRYHATNSLDDVKRSVDHERAQRMEKEALLSKKLSEDVFRLQERLDVERHARESMLVAVREDMQTVGNNREKTEEKFLSRIRNEVSQLKAQLRAEQDARERAEEHLAVTMDEVVQQVQAGLKALVQQ